MYNEEELFLSEWASCSLMTVVAMEITSIHPLAFLLDGLESISIKDERLSKVASLGYSDDY